MANTTGTAAGNTPQVPPGPELPPALVAFLQALKPSMYILLFCAVWLGIAIPLLVILFYTSTRKLRRSGIFISNAIGIGIGITMGVLNVVIQTGAILNPIKGLSRPNVIAYTFLSCSGGLYVDCILLFRVLVVFPRRATPRRLWYSILTPLVLLKIARIVNVIVFMTQFGIKSVSITSSAQYEPLARHLVEETIEWSLQLVDNSICSTLFLWRLNKAQALQSDGFRASQKKSSYHQALGTLFWIATTNFVFPCIFDIIMFILFFRDPDGSHYLIVLISNVYVQIIGVLFATIWRATHESTMSTVEGSTFPQTEELTIEFAPRDVQSSQNATATTVNHSDIELRKPQGEAFAEAWSVKA